MVTRALRRPISALNRKLVRDLWHVRGQVMAIAAVVWAGIASDVTIRGVLRSMMSEKQGSIVALASVAALRANPGQASYAASKGGIVALVSTLAAEVGRHGIRVNAIAPGLFDAGMVKATPPAHREKMRERIPLGRLGDARELARAAMFLSTYFKVLKIPAADPTSPWKRRVLCRLQEPPRI